MKGGLTIVQAVVGAAGVIGAFWALILLVDAVSIFTAGASREASRELIGPYLTNALRIGLAAAFCLLAARIISRRTSSSKKKGGMNWTGR